MDGRSACVVLPRAVSGGGRGSRTAGPSCRVRKDNADRPPPDGADGCEPAAELEFGRPDVCGHHESLAVWLVALTGPNWRLPRGVQRARGVQCRQVLLLCRVDGRQLQRARVRPVRARTVRARRVHVQQGLDGLPLRPAGLPKRLLLAWLLCQWHLPLRRRLRRRRLRARCLPARMFRARHMHQGWLHLRARLCGRGLRSPRLPERARGRAGHPVQRPRHMLRRPLPVPPAVWWRGLLLEAGGSACSRPSGRRARILRRRAHVIGRTGSAAHTPRPLRRRPPRHGRPAFSAMRAEWAVRARIRDLPLLRRLVRGPL